ncbi:hypothetical protein [Arthrobacter sp. N1]|uniref:hypothetical protein n=1 Tax=Arthrobacter sp. N1 TaxID=619291 RepID=UPI003BAFB995
MDGILAPSAALPGNRTIALFPSAIDSGQVVEERSRLQVPPISLVDHLDRVPPVPGGRVALPAYVRRLQRMGRISLRRSYRRR